MKLPKLTHLQFYIVNVIGSATFSSHQIMEALKECGEAREGSAFYQLMSRLEKAGVITGEYKSTNNQSGHYRERFYKLTPQGVDFHNDTLKLYQNKNPL